MSNPGQTVDRPDPIIEYYKQFVDRKALRANLKLTPEERLLKLTARMKEAEDSGKARRTQSELRSASPRWEAISDTSLERTSDPIIELYKRDVDRTLLRENLRKSSEQRMQQLESMAELVEALHSPGSSKGDRA